MVANQVALEDDPGARRELTGIQRAKRIYWAVNHLTALTFVWWELWPFLALAIWVHPLIIVAPLVLLKAHGYRAELATNINQTARHLVRYDWQCHGLGRWQQPRIHSIELGDFTGLRPWLRSIIDNRTLRVIPYTPMAVVIRRADSKSKPEDLSSFAEWAKRHYRYQSASTADDPRDANRDIVTLSGQAMPDEVVAE